MPMQFAQTTGLKVTKAASDIFDARKLRDQLCELHRPRLLRGGIASILGVLVRRLSATTANSGLVGPGCGQSAGKMYRSCCKF